MSTATLGQVTATQDASGIRILLAMDNVAARLTLEALLRKSGYAVDSAASLPEAMEKVEGEQYALEWGIHLTQVTPTSCGWAHGASASQSATIDRYGVGSTATACCTRR